MALDCSSLKETFSGTATSLLKINSSSALRPDKVWGSLSVCCRGDHARNPSSCSQLPHLERHNHDNEPSPISKISLCARARSRKQQSLCRTVTATHNRDNKAAHVNCAPLGLSRSPFHPITTSALGVWQHVPLTPARLDRRPCRRARTSVRQDRSLSCLSTKKKLAQRKKSRFTCAVGMTSLPAVLGIVLPQPAWASSFR